MKNSDLILQLIFGFQNSISLQYPVLLTLYIVLIVLAGSITLASMCFSMYCYLYNTQTDCLRLLRELTFNKKEWKIGQVWTCWERFTYPIFYPFAFSRVRIFVHQIEFLVVSQVGYYSSFIYSWSVIINSSVWGLRAVRK